ncbi:MAG: endonuclease III [Kouleothrix sp.]|nr:endonuclease III [Kouleothrix sp.]
MQRKAREQITEAEAFFPSQEIVREIDRRLCEVYGVSRLGNKDDPLDELIFIILSGATQETKYNATYDALRSAFPTWDDVAGTTPAAIEAIIRFGGLAKKKSTAIARLLAAIVDRVGRADLSFLRELNDEAAYVFLRQLPGVGPKTARCVLSYSLNRPAFAVDAHVERLMRRLGWTQHHRLTDRVHNRLQEIVPPDIRLSLHVNFVVHGRLICTERDPRCADCILADICPSAFRIGEKSNYERAANWP